MMKSAWPSVEGMQEICHKKRSLNAMLMLEDVLRKPREDKFVKSSCSWVECRQWLPRREAQGKGNGSRGGEHMAKAMAPEGGAEGKRGTSGSPQRAAWLRVEPRVPLTLADAGEGGGVHSRWGLRDLLLS